MKKLKSYKTYIPALKTQPVKWHLLDASQPIALGRLANLAAQLLIGKQKATYTPHLVEGDYVVVIYADQLKTTGNKEKEKIYYRHSGYPGSLKKRSLAQQRQLDSCQIIYAAVKGMLPKNKLQALRLQRLKIYAKGDHPHVAQKPIVYDLSHQLRGVKNHE